MKDKPKEVYVSWCTKCGRPILADRSRAVAKRTSCHACETIGVVSPTKVDVALYVPALDTRRKARRARR